MSEYPFSQCYFSNIFVVEQDLHFLLLDCLLESVDSIFVYVKHIWAVEYKIHFKLLKVNNI